MSERDPSRWTVAIGLATAIVVGGAVRVALVAGNPSPLFLWDDAVIHLEVQYLDSLIAAVGQALDERREERRSGADVFRLTDAVERFRREADGVAPTFGRPLHDLAALATYELIGHGWIERSLDRAHFPVVEDAGLWAVPLTSAIAGTLTIPLAFLVARRLWGSGAGLRAAVILAATGGHLLYSIEGFSEALLVLFLYLALWVRARSRDALASDPDRPNRGTFTLGVVLGLGTLVHFRFSILAAVFLVAEALQRRHARGRVARVAGGLVAMLVLAELPYYLLMLVAKERGIAIHPKTYLEQVLFVLAPEGLGYAGSLVRFRLQNLLTYPFALVYLCGVVVTALAVLGIVVERRPAGDEPPRYGPRTAIALFVAPLLFYSVTIPLLRYGATSFALAPLFAGAAIDWIEKRAGRMGGWIVPIVLGVALAETSFPALPRIATDNGYLASVRWVGAKHVTTTPPLSWAILGTDWTVPVPGGDDARQATKDLMAHGAYSAVIDSLVDFMSFEGKGFPAQQRVLRGIEQACRPSRTVANPFGASLVHDLELNYRPFLETLAMHRTAGERRADVIRIHPLAPCVTPQSSDIPRPWNARP